jgi:hypothetical protein
LLEIVGVKVGEIMDIMSLKKEILAEFVIQLLFLILKINNQSENNFHSNLESEKK